MSLDRLDRGAAQATASARARRRAHFDLHAASKPTVYLELFPYFDSVWTGEGTDYTSDPAHFLVNIVGVRFGVSTARID